MVNGTMSVNGNQLVTNSRLLEEAAERARLLGIETTARTQAISSISSQVTSLSDSTSAIAQSLTNLNTSFDAEIATAVGAETLARISAVSDINQTLTSLSTANEAEWAFEKLYPAKEETCRQTSSVIFSSLPISFARSKNR